jgi:hypothetical protein
MCVSVPSFSSVFAARPQKLTTEYRSGLYRQYRGRGSGCCGTSLETIDFYQRRMLYWFGFVVQAGVAALSFFVCISRAALCSARRRIHAHHRLSHPCDHSPTVYILRTDDLLSDYTPYHDRSLLLLERLTHVVLRASLDKEGGMLAINDEKVDSNGLVADEKAQIDGGKTERVHVVRVRVE